MENDITKVVEEMSIQIMVSEEDFIFKTIRPYCENILQRKINRKELEQIILRGAKKGKWIATENEEMNIAGYYCSCCDLPMETEEKTDYCPNCGAKMEDENEQRTKD